MVIVDAGARAKVDDYFVSGVVGEEREELGEFFVGFKNGVRAVKTAKCGLGDEKGREMNGENKEK